MTIIGLIIFIAIFAVVALVGYWIINKFFPEPARMPLLALLGVILLIALIWKFAPGVANYRIL